MIISCDQCLKKFEIKSNLIPDSGRLLQCSSCNHKWFYKKNIPEKDNTKEIDKVILETQESHEDKPKTIIKKSNNINILNDIDSSEKIKRKHLYKHAKNNKLSFLNLILVFIISIVALIILLDTFKNPISLIIPNIEFVLESLYETLKDITLFIQDLF